MIGIYCIHNKITNKYYVGQSVNIEYRWIQHRSRLKKNNHENRHLQQSYNKYGEDAFEYILIEECDKESLNNLEIEYINKYDSYNNGYNLDQGGQGCSGYKHTEEEIKKMRMVQNPKSVLQLDKDLNVIAEWISASHAGKTLGYSARQITSCCRRVNRQKTVHGYYFVYKDEYENDQIDWEYYLNIKKSKPKRVSQYDLNMNLIQIYDSTNSCSKNLNIDMRQVVNTCKHKRKCCHGFIFRYTDEYTEDAYRDDLEYVKNNKLNKTKAKRVSQYDLNLNLIKTYKSSHACAKELDICSSLIRDCCNYKCKKTHGFIFRYTDEYTEEQQKKDLEYYINKLNKS